MTTMWTHEALMLRLQGKPCPIFRKYTKADAYEVLKDLTGQDFGYNAAAWQEWFDNDPEYSKKIPYAQMIEMTDEELSNFFGDDKTNTDEPEE